MDLFKFAERSMKMDDATWARHANPISVYSRFSILPLLCLAIWARVWIGPWCLGLIGLVMVWIWVNPRIVKPPKTTTSWASKGVMGERIFLARKTTPIPGHHMKPATMLATLSGIGLLVMVYGLWSLDVWATVAGVVTTVLSKTWFVDRMVWLYHETQG